MSNGLPDFLYGGHQMVTLRVAMVRIRRLQKLTKLVVDAANPQRGRYIIWDGILPGFGLRIAPTNIKSFIVRYRPRQGGVSAPKRYVTIGRFGIITVEEARQQAINLLGDVAKGNDPAAAT
jgi:hypothetical protein